MKKVLLLIADCIITVILVSLMMLVIFSTFGCDRGGEVITHHYCPEPIPDEPDLPPLPEDPPAFPPGAPPCIAEQGKALICHNDRTVCVALPAVPAHLRHGDTEGMCQ